MTDAAFSVSANGNRTGNYVLGHPADFTFGVQGQQADLMDFSVDPVTRDHALGSETGQRADHERLERSLVLTATAATSTRSLTHAMPPPQSTSS
jgi:hypothetical protein